MRMPVGGAGSVSMRAPSVRSPYPEFDASRNLMRRSFRSEHEAQPPVIELRQHPRVTLTFDDPSIPMQTDIVAACECPCELDARCHEFFGPAGGHVQAHRQ